MEHVPHGGVPGTTSQRVQLMTGLVTGNGPGAMKWAGFLYLIVLAVWIKAVRHCIPPNLEETDKIYTNRGSIQLQMAQSISVTWGIVEKRFATCVHKLATRCSGFVSSTNSHVHQMG